VLTLLQPLRLEVIEQQPDQDILAVGKLNVQSIESCTLEVDAGSYQLYMAVHHTCQLAILLSYSCQLTVQNT